MKKLMITLLMITVAFTLFAGGDKEDTAPMAEPVVFAYNNGTEIESLDPSVIEGNVEHHVYMCLFEGLVGYDPETLDAVPGLAESWSVSDDALTWTFKLRKSNWSDGTPITAQTVVDSWLRFLSPETAAVYAYLPGMVIRGADDYNKGDAGADTVAIRALDDYTFQFDLSGPAPYVLGMLSHYAFAVVPMHTIEKYGDKWILPENFVGNGPFNLTSWEPHEKIVMDKNPDYWDADTVKIDQYIFYPIEDFNTALNMYTQGELNWIEEVPDARLEEMQLDPTYHENAAFITYYYQFNMTKAPYDNPDVRKALAMAVDRQEIVDKVRKGNGFPAYGLTPPLANYPKVVGFKEDFDAARALLAKAGFPNGEGFPEVELLF